MSMTELVNRRRSVRRYLNKPIPKDDLMKCVAAARLAPSACNSQPWTFIIVDDPAIKNQLCEKAFSGIYSMNKFVKDAAAIAVIVSEQGKFLSAVGGQMRNTRYYLIDIGIACEHFILQATELGIGTCWIGWFDEKPVKKILNIPNRKKVDVMIALGYFNDGEHGRRIRKSLPEMSSFNIYHTSS